MVELAHEWQRIEDLPEDWQDLARPDLLRVREEWLDEKRVLTNPTKLQRFEDRLHTLWAIETGIIERLYTVDRGVTESLIEIGLTRAGELRAHGKLTTKAQELIEDQRAALEYVFDFVKSERPLTAGYMRELHGVLTRRQETTEAVDQFGTKVQVSLAHGAWKRQSNNPVRTDGLLHEYCPPDFVQDEIDSLVKSRQQHERDGVPAEVEAAWLHHRFTQIHPFQDGNGRVARALATIVFVKDNFLPLVIRDTDHREQYLDALASADDGDLRPLVDLFADIQVSDLTEAIGAVRTVRGEGLVRVSESAAAQVARRLTREEDAIVSVSDDLVLQAEQVFGSVAAELRRAFQKVDVDLRATVRRGSEDDEHYWKYQIVQCAKQHDYFADLSKPRRWVSLRLQIAGLPNASIVLSLHHRGRVPGIMAGAVFLTLTGQSAKSTDIDEGVEEFDTECAPHPFRLTTATQSVEERFDSWLREAIESSVDAWQRRN